eukprot:TRINITY_DN925_c0_g2_i1.p1 TRINITY_DN925_c0_g2~~TRINITY_DN925_c0_g2_i1.p1  ORF type:complete len:378 (+),score=17.39 TRINITY_DN925_c0_g2_i1:50-1183(+)
MPPQENVVVIDAGHLGVFVVKDLTDRNFHVKLLCRRSTKMYGILDGMGVDMTLVTLHEGVATDHNAIQNIVEITPTDRVVYIGSSAADSEYCNQISHVVDSAVRCGVKQLILMSATGTSRPWSLKALMANSTNLKLGWQRRGEDSVRASGLDYVILKAGLVSKTTKEGRSGIKLRQGDVFGTSGALKPGLHPSAAAALCAACTTMKGRKVTLEVKGDKDQPPCTDPDHDWGASFGALLDDSRWTPPDLDTLVAHDRAVLCCSILFVITPLLVCFVVWLAICVIYDETVEPGTDSHKSFSAFLTLFVGCCSSFSMLFYWRKTIFRGCCCCIPLDYSTTGRRAASTPHIREAELPEDPTFRPLLAAGSDDDEEGAIQAC